MLTIEIEHLSPDQSITLTFEDLRFPTDEETRNAYYTAKKRYSVSFEQCRYLMVLMDENDPLIDFFYLSEEGYHTLAQDTQK